MIKITLFKLLFFCVVASICAQSLTVTEETENILDANGNALRVEITIASEKTILKEWKSKLKKFDGEVKIKGNELSALNVKINSISEHEIKVYTKVKDVSKTLREVYFIFLNGDLAISSSSDISGYTAAKEIVSSFAKELSKEATEDHHAEQEKHLGKLEGSLRDLIREKERAEKEISDCNESIKDNEYKLKTNKESQAEMIKKIEAQKVKVKDAKNNKEVFE